MHFPDIGEVGVYKVGITYCADDSWLHAHRRTCGMLLGAVQVRDRATALALERRILEHYMPAAAVTVPPELLPRGGTTECWSAHAGYPDLAAAAATLTA